MDYCSLPKIVKIMGRTDQEEVNTVNKYEILFIIRPDIEDKEQKEVQEYFQTILKDNGAEVLDVNEWGKRRLAYEINDFREGVYVIILVQADTAVATNEFDRLAKINENIIRHLIVRKEEARA